MTGRLAWLDIAKGGAILLVVLHHCIGFASVQGLAHDAYRSLDFFLLQIRMPLFFVTSGIATSFVINRSRGEFFARKLLPIVWIFLFWSLVLGVAFEGVAIALPWTAKGALGYLGGVVLHPKYGMWFVELLGFLCLLAVLLRGTPPAAVLVGALAISLLNDLSLLPRDATPFSGWVVNNLMKYAVFFFTGLYGSRTILAAASASTVERVSLVLGGALVLFLSINLAVKFGRQESFEMTQTIRAASGALAGLCFAILLSRWPPMEAPLSWLGKLSLAIFVGHGLVLVPLAALVSERLAGVQGIALVLPLLFAAIAVGGALLLFLGLSRMGLGWLYVLPPEIGRAISAGPTGMWNRLFSAR